MNKNMLALAIMLVLSASYGPSVAFADYDEDVALTATNEPMLGTVETTAVTGPITVGDITYIPALTGGGSGSAFLGTVETAAVTGPTTVGDITYIPMSAG